MTKRFILSVRRDITIHAFDNFLQISKLMFFVQKNVFKKKRCVDSPINMHMKGTVSVHGAAIKRSSAKHRESIKQNFIYKSLFKDVNQCFLTSDLKCDQ